MSILILNLSPRRLGTSALLGRLLQEQLGEQTQVWNCLDIESAWDSFLETARLAETWICIAPCYVNAIPGDAVEVLAKLHQAELSRNKYVYAIAQGGMPYAHTHHCCIGNIELFARAMQLRWMGGLLIGGGAIIDGVSLKRLPNAVPVEHCLQKLIACIQHKTKVDSLLSKQAEMKIPGFVARLMCLKMNHTIHKQQKKIKADRHICFYAKEEKHARKG